MAIQDQKRNQNDTTSSKSTGRSESLGQSTGSGSESSFGTSSTGAGSMSGTDSPSKLSSVKSSYSAGTTGTLGATGSTSSTGLPSRTSQSEGIIGQVKSSASDALGTVKTRATEKIEEQKHTLASGLTSVADNIRRLGSQVSTEPQTSENIAKYAGQYSETAAAKLEQAATYFDENDLNAIYHDVENAARNNAAIFIGGAFALGFLAARFLKSSRSGSGVSTGRRLGNGNGESGQRMESDVQSLGH